MYSKGVERDYAETGRLNILTIFTGLRGYWKAENQSPKPQK